MITHASRKSLLLACAAASAYGVAPMAYGQDDGAESGSLLDEITVTARRVEEALIDSPVAVTAVTGDELVRNDIAQITGIADQAPNVNFSFAGTSSGSDSAAVVFIRGVGQNDFTLVTDPGVGIYVDGVYLGRTVGAVLDVFDLKQVEVLRGPQGTVFGRNTIGGAINVTTNDIGDELSGSARLLVGDDNRFEQFFRLSVPVSDTFAFSVSAFNRDRDGTVERQDGVVLGDDNAFGGRFKAVWTPTDFWRSTFSFDAMREDEESAAEALLDGLEDSTFYNFFNNNTFGNGTTDPAGCAGGGAIGNLACANDQFVLGPFASAETGPSFNEITNFGFSLTNEFDLTDTLTIKTISGYRDVDAAFARASDGTPFDIFNTTTTYVQDQFSQEVQLLGSAFEDRVNWVGGFFYFEEDGRSFDTVSFLPPTSPLFIGAEIDNSNWATFGEATIDLTNRLTILGGIRYTDETKRTDLTSVSLTLPIDNLSGAAAETIRQNFTELTWRASAIYSIVDQANVYFTASRGFKSGGVVQRLTQANTVAPTFDPEFVTLYELGLKSEFPEIGLRVNIAGFISDYDDIQLDGVQPGQFGTVQFNGGVADINGLEVEFDWAPVQGLRFNGAFGYIDAEFTEIAEGSLVTLEDELIRTPEITWSLNGSYEFYLGEFGSLVPGFNWVYKASHAFEATNTDLTTEDGYHALDLTLAYEDPTDAWRVIAGVNNVTDEEYLVAADFNGAIGYELGVFARPRNFFVSLDYDF
ncbi:MAG: TonB-dependent receptor [Pseudomonadota bacterium]